MPPETCPNCGADVPPKAKACPECGADEKTGWSETAYASSLGIPGEDEEFDYEKFVKQEFGGGSGVNKARPHGISWLWWVTGLVLVLLFLLLFFR